MDQRMNNRVNFLQNMGHINRAEFSMGPNAQGHVLPQNIKILYLGTLA